MIHRCPGCQRERNTQGNPPFRCSCGHVDRSGEGLRPSPDDYTVQPTMPKSPDVPLLLRQRRRIGTNLKRLMDSVGIVVGGCQCKTKATEWDRKGAVWCREHKSELVSWLVDQAVLHRVDLYDAGFALLKKEARLAASIAATKMLHPFSDLSRIAADKIVEHVLRQAEDAPPRLRHLVYHLGPFAKTNVWRKNLEQLFHRWDLFTGRKIVAILTGPGMVPSQYVREAFGDRQAEFLEIPNQQHLREVATFVPMWSWLQDSMHTDDITFFAHAKGVTHPDDGGVSVHRWTGIMYETLLDYFPLIEQQLDRFPITGSFKRIGSFFDGSQSRWHYSGTFYWVRNRDVFARDWSRIDRTWYGAESWPGVHFGVDEGGCVFHQTKGPMDLYSMDYMRNTIEPAYEQWQKEHETHHDR